MQMRWFRLFALGLAIAAASTAARASDKPANIPVLKAAFGCKLTKGQIVCGNTKSSKNKDTESQGKHDCGPGYVELKEKNEYGSFCEPEGGLPAPAPAQAETCQFPGEVGTPPNCTCPNGTEFLGYKGCVKYTREEDCTVGDTIQGDAFADKCIATYHGQVTGFTINTDPPHGKEKVCCHYKVYAP